MIKNNNNIFPQLDCTSPECELLSAKYTITDDLAEKVYSHYSFSRQENIYNSTYVQVYAMGFSQKIRSKWQFFNSRGLFE